MFCRLVAILVTHYYERTLSTAPGPTCASADYEHTGLISFSLIYDFNREKKIVDLDNRKRKYMCFLRLASAGPSRLNQRKASQSNASTKELLLHGWGQVFSNTQSLDGNINGGNSIRSWPAGGSVSHPGNPGRNASGAGDMELAADLEDFLGRSRQSEQGGGQAVMADVDRRQPASQGAGDAGCLAEVLADGARVPGLIRGL